MGYDLEILTGKVCPYCGNPSEYIDSKKIYGTSYGMIYACIPCDAYVGVHKDNPEKALGRLADFNLRKQKTSSRLFRSFMGICSSKRQKEKRS